jgi:hypothetical protein
MVVVLLAAVSAGVVVVVGASHFKQRARVTVAVAW